MIVVLLPLQVSPIDVVATSGTGVAELGYDINLNYLGVRRTESGVRREERRRNPKYKEKVFFVG
ncbi:MAG: hypothetical protein F6K23_01350 [Okeania sp. SIO2C9]|uniref:hypothetical protein n=1 Tax=Okeania sp. SIO2C9 TaxID=2607791 RepID=UPI0013C059A4|nr:hypothetical protein [Okeania sp. SIO2C9]NEQ71841.1 hypothetical protein [Okeania sp. SIO2C9]